MQQTSFRYEVLVHDDASTDKSQQIILEYAQKYPDVIKPILQKENQYSKGKGILAPILFPQCKGKYIAFCECDDYWTDSNKMQRQIDFLESHQSYSAIADNGTVLNLVSHTEYPFNTSPSHDVSMKEIIISRKFPTAGVICRKEALNGYDETCQLKVDTIQWCWLISNGKFRYENIISSVYRKGEQGMTVYTDPYELAKTAQEWNLEILRVFNIEKDFMFAHIAKAYFDCAKSSTRRLNISSLCKCMYFYCVYKLKSLLAKIC